MSDAAEVEFVRDWVLGLLVREGALLEPTGDGAHFAVLPPRLREALRLEEAPTLRILEPARAGETALVLEGEVLRACLERAETRGARASATLRPVSKKSSGVHDAARRCFAVDNAAVRDADARVAELLVLLLEVDVEAGSDERTARTVLVACEPSFRAASLEWAERLHARLDEAEPDQRLPSPEEIERALPLVAPLLPGALHELLGPFLHEAALRMAKERARLIDYHARLHAEAHKRRGRAALDTGALEAKLAAIARRRDEKLEELRARFAPTLTTCVRSVLALRYSARVADFVVRRRTREATVSVVWDPFLQAPLPRGCAGCHAPGTVFHACDAAVHLCCARCAAPCRACRCASEKSSS